MVAQPVLHDMQSAVLCCAVLCCAVLCCAVLCAQWVFRSNAYKRMLCFVCLLVGRHDAHPSTRLFALSMPGLYIVTTADHFCRMHARLKGN